MMKEKKRINMFRTGRLVLSVILLLTGLPCSVFAEEKTESVIRIGSFEDVYNVINSKGERSGYGYEYLQDIAGYTGWSYDYVDSNWEECFSELEKGNIDILGGISFTEERAQRMLFSSMPMGEERYYIYTDASNESLSAGNLSSFDGKNIGVLIDHIPEEILNSWEKKNHLTLHHINVASTEEIMDKLGKKEIDCFVSVESSMWEELECSPITYLGESSIYFAINRNRPEIKEALDSAMRRIKNDNPFYTVDLYRRYLSARSSSLLSKEEREWLIHHGAIRIGYLNGDKGVSIVNPETGELAGVIMDYVETARNSLQGYTLNFDLKGYDTRGQQLAALHNGEIDLIFHVSQNPYSAETNDFVLSDTVWTFNIAAITTTPSFDENASNRVAVSRDNFAMKAYIAYNYPQWTVDEYETKSAALKAMKNGKADCVLRNSSEVAAMLKNKKLHSFFLTKPADASFAVRKGEPLLLSVMNKTLMSIPSSKLSGAMMSYSNAMDKTTIVDFFRDNAGIAFVFSILIIGVISIFLFKSIKNGKELLFNSRVLSGLSTDYTIAFVLNLDTDTYKIAFNQITNHAKKDSDITTFTEYVDTYVEHFVLPEFRDSMRMTLNYETIRKTFDSKDDYHFYFETTPNAAGLSCFQAHIVKEYDEGGHFAFLGFRSVDEAIRQEQDYKKMLQNQLNLIASSLPGGVKISNDDETYSFKYVSEQFASMLGYDSPEELMSACGGSIVGLAHPDDLNVGIADALDQYSRADHYETTYRMRCKDGSYKYIEDRGQKVITADGTVEHWNLILDKNELMEKSIALESEKKANQSKSDFLARMSHDMRTPLNGIVGLMKINLDHFDEIELVRENYRKMRIAAEHLQSLINDVLQMSKIEDGTVPLTHEVINFMDLSKEIMVMMEQKAEDSNIRLEFEAKKEKLLYPYVYGSPLHLKQVFLNIYGNCIKYNRKGGSIITVCDYELDKKGRCVYEWVISDTGIGMSKEFLEHIFEPFVQEKDDARSAYQGVGLGMPIVKGLLEKMNGTITVESEAGVGSTFTVRIPFEIARTPETKEKKIQEEEVQESIEGLKLLLVEDNDLNAEIAEMILDDAGAEVTLVRDGKQAVEVFGNSQAGNFDAILMDIMMPVMNGYEATRVIRSLEHPDAKNIPIIAMTANAFVEDANKCLEAGMNAHLAKPLELGKIEATICEQIRLRTIRAKV